MSQMQNTTANHSPRVAIAACAVTIATALLTAAVPLTLGGDPPASPTSMHNIKHV